MIAALGTINARPTEAQKQAGNYAKGHVKVLGFDITVENPRGSMRRGIGPTGKPWQVRLPAHYGYFKRTEGADGDHVDVYVGPHLKSQKVFVVDQVDAESGDFDEHKVLLGFASYPQARNTYVRGFSDGKGEKRIGAMTEMTVDQFRRWLKDGNTAKAMAAVHRAAGGRVGYAEGGEVDDWSAFPAATPAKDEWAAFPAAAPPAEKPSLLSRIAKPFTDIPREAYRTTAEALSTTGHYLNPFSAERQAAAARGDQLGPLLDTGKGLASVLGIPMAPVIGAARSLIGHPMSEMLPTRTPEEQKKLRDLGVSEGFIPGATTEENYERAKGHADTAMSALAPRGSPVRVPAAPGAPRGPYDIDPARLAYDWSTNHPTPTPAAPARGPLGVTLTEGQETGALPLIQKEQAALRGNLGEAAQARAKEFADQQRTQVAAATEDVGKQLDPFGQRVAETPQEAGRLVSEGVQSAAAQRKAAVTQAYDVAKAQPGEIHAGAFEGVGQKIKGDLSLRDDPIIIDDKLTPFASHAIRDVEDRISKLTIQNRADPFGAPNPENIVGVNLKGVDQMRRRLSAFRKDAYGSGNAADGRAARAVIDAFDKHVDNAVNGGLFNGDPRAIQAWNDARAAHADYKSTFSAGKNDPVGRVVERILGKQNNPAAIPNDVADFMYGGSGINPSSLNVGVAKRVRSILGEQSPEWSAVKQGLFQRLVDSGPGVTDWGPGKIAQRVNKFMNADGLELSKEVFAAPERRLIQQYADLQRKLEVPQAGANWSNTATILAPMLKKVSSGIAAVVGAVIGHTVAPGLYGAGEGLGMLATNRVGKTITDARQLRQISTQMPLVAEQVQKWQRAVAATAKSNTPISQRAADLASANLARSLQNIGLDPVAMFRQAQGANPSRADQQQQQ